MVAHNSPNLSRGGSSRGCVLPKWCSSSRVSFHKGMKERQCSICAHMQEIVAGMTQRQLLTWFRKAFGENTSDGVRAKVLQSCLGCYGCSLNVGCFNGRRELGINDARIQHCREEEEEEDAERQFRLTHSLDNHSKKSEHPR